MGVSEVDQDPSFNDTAKTITRTRLLSRIANAARYPVTTIIAPAGFGKSTVLREFLRSQSHWILYAVAGRNVALIPFVRGLCDTLSTIVPALRASLPSAIDSASTSASPGEDLAAWVCSHIRSVRQIVAIDNLDACADDDITIFLQRLVMDTRDNAHWIFVSRASTHLPTVAWSAYAYSDLTIGTEDLRFNVSDALDIARLHRISLSTEDLQLLLTLTKGWPVAFDFALRTSANIQDLESLTRTTRSMMYDFLADQVWRSLEPADQTLLEIATFLPKLDVATVRQSGFKDADVALERLRLRAGLLSKSDGVYELHRLFKDFIQSHLSNEDTNKLHVVRLRAAKVLEQLDLPVAALELYIEAGAAIEIDNLLTLHNFDLIDRGHTDVIRRALLITERRESAAVLALRASIEESRGRIAAAETLYQRAINSETSTLTLRAAIAWRYSLLLYQQGRTDAIPVLERLLDDPDLEGSDRADVLGSCAILLAFAGEQLKAAAYVTQAIGLAQNGADVVRARALGRASAVAYFANDTVAVEQYAREAAEIAEDSSLYALAARIKTSLSALHLSEGRLNTAVSYAAQIVADAERAGDQQLRARGLRELLALQTEVGNVEGVVAAELELEKTDYNGPTALISLIIARGVRLIWASDFVGAIELLSQRFSKEPTWHQDLLRTALLSVAAAAAEKQHVLSAAIAEFDSIAELGITSNPRFDRERSLCFRYAAIALLLSGDRVRSRAYLKRASAVRANIELDNAVHALSETSNNSLDRALRELASSSQGGIARVIRIVSESRSWRAYREGRLTASEMAVLRAMTDGLSNKAIAASQGTTINTVRTQVSSILRKLGSASRGEAVATAHRRGLL